MGSPVTSQVMIANSALLKIGADPISALTDNVRRAVVCNTLFQYLADEVMGESPWRFATRRTILTPNQNNPPYDFTYSYDIPDDCLRLLVPQDDAINWQVEDAGDWSNSETQIITNVNPLNIKYIFRNLDPSSWDARFCEALAWRLAMELALSLTQSIPMKQECEKSYDKALENARSMNAVIGTIPPLEADIWSLARKGYRYYRPQDGQVGDNPDYGPVNNG